MTTEQAIERIEDTKAEIKKKISGLPPLMRDRTSMNSIVQALEMAVSALREQENNRWIPVSERLPHTIPCGAGTEYSEAVNVLTSGRKVLTAIFDGTDFIADAEFWEADDEVITHWTPVLLPLSNPPKEG